MACKREFEEEEEEEEEEDWKILLSENKVVAE